jgi:dihydroxyacetone kinase-like protein
MTIGGASGPLAATFLMALGRRLAIQPDRFADAFGGAVAAFAQRGRAQTGEKTALDVLVPLAEAIARGRSVRQLAAIADHASHATIPLRALRGRASYLGDRSIGHMDPGARSVAVLAGAVAHWCQGPVHHAPAAENSRIGALA